MGSKIKINKDEKYMCNKKKKKYGDQCQYNLLGNMKIHYRTINDRPPLPPNLPKNTMQQERNQVFHSFFWRQQ